jgi:hypothetical protein
MTREEIRTRVLTALNDSSTDPAFWSLEEMNHLLDEAQEVLSEEVEAFSRTLYVPLRPGVGLYTLLGVDPLGRVQTPWRLWSRNRQHRLWSLSLPELDGHYERWQTVAGDPEWWYPFSWDCFGVWPVPAATGGILEVDCFVWPDPLQEDTDEPECPDPDHDVLVSHMEIEGQVKQWDVARALELMLPLMGRWKDSQARSGLKQVQERYFARDEQRGFL